MKQDPTTKIRLVLGHAVLLIAAAAVLVGCERPPVETTQNGFRGTGMVDVQNPRDAAAEAARNVMPVALPALPAGGPAASTVYKNVKVLGGLSVGEFTRTMVAMTNWVSPKEGCAYCHNPADMASDEKYAKVVSRRMLEMTEHINTTWKPHVADTGVTCHTCHRGNPVPENIWFTDVGDPAGRFAGNRAGQNAPSEMVGLASLPHEPFTAFLAGEPGPIRIEGVTALPVSNRASIKQAEWTYGLMMNFSQSLGVNCTYCHNTRQFTSWSESPPTRAQAWHGIQMVRDLNTAYLVPLKDTFPVERHGPTGDGPKLYCATCHQGAAKPLNGAKMAADYPAMLGPVAAAAAPAAETPAAVEAAPDAAPAAPAGEAVVPVEPAPEAAPAEAGTPST